MNARQRVAELLRDGAWLSHKEIADHLGISRYTAERAIQALQDEGAVRSRWAYVPEGCPGRKPREFSLANTSESTA